MQSAKLGKYQIYFENGEEYHRIKREVWGANCYYIELPTETPTILDLGAHIGITTLYFKRLFPHALVVAVEPVQESARLLSKNVYENQLENVEIVEMAVADHEGEISLHKDRQGEWYSTASVNPGAWTGDQESEEIKVKSEKLSYFLDKYHPDLVKMDIEGAEERVILSSKESLNLCPHYLIEFHPVDGQGMERIVKTFHDLGYKVQVEKGGKLVEWSKARGLTLLHVTK